MRCIALLALAAAASTAEVARRDLQLAVDVADGAYDYTLDTDLGSFAGSDAFERIATLRLGGRYAFGAIGTPIATLVGVDLTRSDAPMSGGGLEALGADLSAGATWAVLDGWSLDAEAFAGWQRADIDLAAGSAPLAGSGSLLRYGARARLLWSPWTRWSVGLEAAWTTWSSDLDMDDGRSLNLEGSGIGAGMVLAWRPSIRPAGVE